MATLLLYVLAIASCQRLIVCPSLAYAITVLVVLSIVELPIVFVLSRMWRTSQMTIFNQLR